MWEYNLFGLKFNFSPVAFTIGNFSVYWYGIIIAVGFLAAFIHAYRTADRFSINKDRLTDVVIGGMLGAIVCARLYSVAFEHSGIETFADVFAIHDGGLSIFGALIGAFGIGAIMCRFRKVNILDAFDITAVNLLIGQCVGRWGNFFNQEVYGLPTGSSWFGIGGTAINGGNGLVHPLFLYESIWTLAGFILLNRLSKHRKFKGQIFSLYLIWYCSARFILETLRDRRYQLMFGNIDASQLTAFIGLILGVVLFFILKNRTHIQPEPEYEAQFGVEIGAESVLSDADSDDEEASVAEMEQKVLEELEEDDSKSSESSDE